MNPIDISYGIRPPTCMELVVAEVERSVDGFERLEVDVHLECEIKTTKRVGIIDAHGWLFGQNLCRITTPNVSS